MVGISRGGEAGGRVEGPSAHGSWCRIDPPKGVAPVVEKEATVGTQLGGGADPEAPSVSVAVAMVDLAATKGEAGGRGREREKVEVADGSLTGSAGERAVGHDHLDLLLCRGRRRGGRVGEGGDATAGEGEGTGGGGGVERG